MLLLGNANRQVDLSLAGSLPGGSGIDIALLVGEPPADSPLIAVTDTNDVIVRTAQVRLKVDTRIATPLASVHIPLLAELGSASARITDIDCAPNSSAAVSLGVVTRSEEHTSELQSLMRISYAVFCLKKKNIRQ